MFNNNGFDSNGKYDIDDLLVEEDYKCWDRILSLFGIVKGITLTFILSPIPQAEGGSIFII